MFARVLRAAVTLSAMAPLTAAQTSPDASLPDAVYQAFTDKVTSFIAAQDCSGDSAKNPQTGRVLPPIWLRFTFHDSGTLMGRTGGGGGDWGGAVFLECEHGEG
ncbi:hypothetical protein BDK51DRAFT_49816, partial [Blyttiomyces helicus]